MQVRVSVIAGAAATLAAMVTWAGLQAHGEAAAPAVQQVGIKGAVNANPSIAARGAFVAVAWGASSTGEGSDVYVAVSRDGGASFTTPVRANVEAGEARLGAERPPVIAVIPTNRSTPDVAVLWTAGRSDTAVKLARSTDGGRTFGRPQAIQAPGARGNRGWASMAAAEDGSLHVVWLDHRDTAPAPEAGAAPHQHGTSAAPSRDGAAAAQRSGLYYAKLGPGAVSERLIARGVCYCCKTAVSAGSGGRLAAAWRHVYPGNLRDIAAATSIDNGGSFTAPQRVSEDGWSIDGCPENGPSVIVQGAAQHVVWPTVVGGREPAGAVFYTYSSDGRAFSNRLRISTAASRDPEHVQVVRADGGDLMVAWDEVVEGTRRVVATRVRPGEGAIVAGQPIVVSAGRPARHPALAATSTGVVAAWTDGPAGGATTIGVRAGLGSGGGLKNKHNPGPKKPRKVNKRGGTRPVG